MAIFICPSCKSTQDAPDQYIGRTARCLKCGGHGKVTARSQQQGHDRDREAQVPVPMFHIPAKHDPSELSLEEDWDVLGVAKALTVVAAFELVMAPLAGFYSWCKRC